MAKIDERMRAEIYKINQGKFFLSVNVIVIFLYIKISMQVGILGMLGELTAATVILLYLIPYFRIRYKYKTLDEMVKNKLHKLSAVFFILEFVSMIPIIIIDIILLEGETFYVMNTSFAFIITVGIVTGLYGLVRKYNEKFTAEKAAQISLNDYRKRLLLRAVIVTVALAAAITILALVINYVRGLPEYAGVETGPPWLILLSALTLICIFSVPAVWFFFLYYLGIRIKLEEKLQADSENEAKKLHACSKNGVINVQENLQTEQNLNQSNSSYERMEE